MRHAQKRMARCTALDDLLNTTLAGLADHLGIRHAMVLMLDASSQRLYTVASCGYATSGVGSGNPKSAKASSASLRADARLCASATLTSARTCTAAPLRSLYAQRPRHRTGHRHPYRASRSHHSQLAVPSSRQGACWACCSWKPKTTCGFSFEDEGRAGGDRRPPGRGCRPDQTGTEAAEARNCRAGHAGATSAAVQVRYFPPTQRVHQWHPT